MTSLQNRNHQPPFFDALSPKTHSTKWEPSPHINLAHFCTLWFWQGKKTKPFCRENPWQPRDTSGYFYWILGVYGTHVVARWLTCCCLPWHYKMTTLQVLETSTSTKWQPRVVFQQHHPHTKAARAPVPTQKNSPKVCCGERMCIMSPSLTSLKLLYHTWSALLQSFPIFFICSRSCNKHNLHASIFFIHL